MNRLITRAGTVPGLLLATATLALAGCGGSSSSSSSAAGADFVTRANQICTTVNNKIAALPPITTSAEIVKLAPKEVSAAQHGVAQLKALTPSSAQKVTANQYIATLDQATALSTRLIAAVKNGNIPEANRLAQQSKSAGRQNNARAIRLGLTQCAKDVQPGSANSSGSSTG